MNIYGKTLEDLVTHIRTHRCYCLDNPCEFHVFNSTYCGDTKNTQNCPFRFPDDDIPSNTDNTGDTGDIESAPLAEDAYTPTAPTDNVVDRVYVLSKARECVCGDREQDYGSPESNFKRIADLWNVYLGNTRIAPKDVAAMLAMLKLARIASGHSKADNWIDLAGYAACGGELEAMSND